MANPIVGVTVKYRNPNTGSWNTLNGWTSLNYTLTRNTEPSNATIRIKNVLHENNPVGVGAEVEIYRYLNKASSYTPVISDLKFEGYVIPDSAGIGTAGDYVNLNVTHRKSAFNYNTFYGEYKGLIYTTGSGYGFINVSNAKTITSDIVANYVSIPTFSSTGASKTLSLLQSKPASFSSLIYDTEIQDEPCGEALNNLITTAGDFFWDFERRTSSGIPYFAVYKSSSGTVIPLRQQQSGHSINEADILGLDYKEDATQIINRYKVFFTLSNWSTRVVYSGITSDVMVSTTITEFLDLKYGWGSNNLKKGWISTKETDLRDGTIHLAGEGGWCAKQHSKVEPGIESSGYADVFKRYIIDSPLSIFKNKHTAGITSDIIYKMSNVELTHSSGVDSGMTWIEKRKYINASGTVDMETIPVNTTIHALFSPSLNTQETSTKDGMNINITLSERNMIWTPYNLKSEWQQLYSTKASSTNPYFEGDMQVRIRLTYELDTQKNVTSGLPSGVSCGSIVPPNYTPNRDSFYVGKGCAGVVNLGWNLFSEIESTMSAGFVSDYPYTITKPVYVNNIFTIQQLDNVITQVQNKLAVTGNIKKSCGLRCVVNSATDALTLANRVNISGSIGDAYKNNNGFPMNIEQITFNYSPNDVSITLGLNRVNQLIPLPINKPLVGYR